MFQIRPLWPLVSVMLLAGCASMNSPMPPAGDAPAETSLPASPSATVSPPPDAPAPGAEVMAEPVTRGSVDEPRSLVLPPLSGNTAVLALLDRAHLDSEAGRRDAAGAALERALRIEPRNPWLWHKLAQVRLAEGQYGQAVSLAQKSNSFARQDRGLQVRNWRLIGDARVAQGNHAAAEQAMRRAQALEQ